MNTNWSHMCARLLAWVALVLVGLVGSAGLAHAQFEAESPDDVWTAIEAPPAYALDAAAVGDGEGPRDFRTFQANVDALQAILSEAPLEADAANRDAVVLTLPLADGEIERFQIAEYVMLEPALAASLPTVKTYLGWGLDTREATVRLSMTDAGFSAMILDGQSFQYVDAIDAESGLYRSYDGDDLPEQTWAEKLLEEDHELHAQVEAAAAAEVNIGETLVSYRLAVAATGEFTQRVGSKQAAKEAIVTIINQLNGLYEREVSIRFVLVDNDAVIYTNPTTDPFSSPIDGNGQNDWDAMGRMLNENQQTLDQQIGSANYDIGHVLGIGSGGLAGPTPCSNTRKAFGTSNGGNPQDPGFVTGLLAHEVGHQFGAGHTFNATACGGHPGQSAYEPGSGSTIMSYGGVCQGQNIVNGGDGYFHAFSIQQMTQLVNDPNAGGACGTRTPTNNAVPVVTAGPDATIPAQTPFKLAGSATDADGDALTYTWEQFDAGSPWTNGGVLPNTDLGDNPILRSFPPGPASTRYIPAINNPAAALGESLPTTNRVMKFRLTARDGKTGVGSDDINVTVAAGAGPFAITAPAPGSFWTPGSEQTVSWTVANTNQAPVNCANVNIMASSDGGANFVALKTNTPNDGTETVTASTSGTVLIMVECAGAGQIFYALSPQPGVRVCTPILQDNHEDGAGGWTVGGPPNPPGPEFYKPWTLRTDGGFSGSNYWFVDNNRNGLFTTLDSQQVTATSNNITLSFVHKYEFFNLTNQIGRVQIKVNDGEWQNLAGYTEFQNAYAETQIDLSPHVNNGDTFQIRFRRENNSNSFMVLNAARGWSLDDVLICGTDPVAPPPQPPVIPDTGDRTWTGAASADWGNAANWNPQAVPTAQNNAVIPAGLGQYPAINGDFEVASMLIAGGANVAMTGGELKVHGNWGQTNAATAGQPVEVCRTFGTGEGQVNEAKTFGPGPVSDTLTVATGSPIADIDLFMDVTHTWVGDIVATLRHVETGRTVTVFDPSNDNCNGRNFAFSLDDEATTGAADACVSNATPAYPGNRYQADNALSAFDGEVSAGQWTLTLSDVYPSLDDGTLNRWCVNITPVGAGGVFNGTGGTVVFAGAQTQIVRVGAGTAFNNVQIGSGTSAQQVQLTNAIDVNGNLVIAGNARLEGGAATINIAGNWQQPTSASFSPGTSSVIFDGGNQTVSLGAAGTVQATAFNILTVNQGSTVDFGYSWPQVAQQFINEGTVRQTKDLPANYQGGFFGSGGYGGVGMSVAGQAPGTTVISISKQVNGCTALAGETVQRCFDINPQNKTGFTAALTFFYNETEQSGNSCTFMNAYQNDLSGTELPELAVEDRSCTGPLRSIRVGGVNNFTTTAFTLGSDVGGDNKRSDDPPVAVEDEAVYLVGQETYVIQVLLNDFDPEGLPLTLDFVGSAQHGQTTIERGVVKYTPEPGYVGEDTFTYEISDVGEQSDTATVTIRLVEEVSDTAVFLPLIAK